MKKSILLIIISLSSILGYAQAKGSFRERVSKFQSELNEEFRNPKESPLDSLSLIHFSELEFFPPDSSFCFQATLERTPDEKPFMMKKSKNKEAPYVKYGIISFSYQQVTYRLPVYKNLVLCEKEGFQDYLFLPFTDPTNGISTYGGGRYIDLREPRGNEILLDFNLAYNPYCAYSHRYSCPVPPKENDLPFEVKAGVKAFNEEK